MLQIYDLKSMLQRWIFNYLLNMQRLKGAFTTTWYFAFGAPEKSSLAIQYCRENKLTYLNNPTLEQLQNTNGDIIIEGSIELFNEVEKNKPQLNIIAFNVESLSDREKELRLQYRNLCRCIDINQLDYSAFRKAMYPNIVFIFGPNTQQNWAASTTLAREIGYQYSVLPNSSNDFIAVFDKTKNYVINGVFPSKEEITILQEYFKIRIVHFKYKREDLPQQSFFFDQQYDLLPFLKQKSYYIPIKGDQHPIKVMDDVGVGLCPKMTYIQYGQSKDKKSMVDQHLKKTNGVILDIQVIENLLKRKNLPALTNNYQRTVKLTQILYRNLDIKEVFITGYPVKTEDFVSLENINRPLSCYIDLSNPSDHKLTKQRISQIYYLQNHLRITPNLDLPLSQSITQKNDHWIVNGAGSCGKTTIAKYIAGEFGFQLIEFDAKCAELKEKLANPDQGDEVPVKKFIAYFGNLIKSNPTKTYIFDNLPYQKGDLQEWIKVVGAPHVINLKVEATQQIKRGKKKAGDDPNGQINQQQTANATKNIQKNAQWIEKLGQISPVSKIYQIQYKMPQLLAQPIINSILKPRIYLVQKNNNLIYQNIAIRHNMGFISLKQKNLKSCLQQVKKCDKRDIIICNYSNNSEKMVSQDLYWIEKNLGEIRYLGIWNPQKKDIKQQKLHLQKPVKQEKPKKAQGQQGQEQPPAEPADEGEQGAKKKVLDIYEYQWTQPSEYKNLSQWFFKLKKDVKQRNNAANDCYEKFGEVIQSINESPKNYIYEILK